MTHPKALKTHRAQSIPSGSSPETPPTQGTYPLAVVDVRKAEAVHAAQLGPRYQGQSTEFSVLRAALENAREAMNLAGMDTDAAALA
ncbi:hypothetical protein, partial [Gordonia paraffinivorans]